MNKKTPKLSIITVCFNNKNGLQKTMESVKAQTFRDYEYIIIDGGSSDGTVDLIKENEQYIDYWISEKDTGIYNAMNKGIKVAKGEYCYFLNSDDYIAKPNTLERIFDQVKDNPDIIYGNLAIRKGDKLVKVSKYKSELTFYTFYRRKGAIHHQASFIKRELFDKYGYYREDVKIVADGLFYFNTVVMNNASTQYVDRVFAVFLANGVSSIRLQSDIDIRSQIYDSAVPKLVTSDYKKMYKKRETRFSSYITRLLRYFYLLRAKVRDEV